MQKLLNQIDILKKRGELVFTNGCFDIIHRGHIHYLNQAKELGQSLVIGINDDLSIKRLKGDDRPINNLKDRIFHLMNLKAVDLVLSFSEDTPLELIKIVKPDVLVKGGDWSIEDIVGGREVSSWGGEVRSLDLVQGYSTTNIISQLKK